MEQQIFEKMLYDSIPGLFFECAIAILLIVMPLSLNNYFRLKKIERFLDETTCDSLWCSFTRIIYSRGIEYPVMHSFLRPNMQSVLLPKKRYAQDKHGKRKRLYEAFIPIGEGISEEEEIYLKAEFEKPDPEALKYGIDDPGREVVNVEVKMFVVNYGEVRRRLYFYYLENQRRQS